nr:MAG TPA: hypothetical protein [Caudoviricetes sp.]
MSKWIVSLICIAFGACSGVCWYHKKWIGVFCSWVCILLIILLNIIDII